VAEALAVEAQQVDRGEVRLRVDALVAQGPDRLVAVHVVRQLHDVNEPAAALPVGVGTGQPEAVDAAEPLAVERRDARPPGEQLLEPFELGEAERAGDVVEPVVEAEPVVIEPAHVRRPALVALGVDAFLRLGVGTHDHASLARRDLLVRVEAEDGEVAARARGAAVGVQRPECLAGVLDEPERAV
jgi:hypothetical protein